MRRAPAALSLLAVLALTRVAGAVENEWEGDYGLEAERRSDFTAGVSFGLIAASTYGYPNKAGKIDDDRYVADSGVGLGTASTYWLGGALRDWFTFAIGYWNVGYAGNDLDAAGYGILFRVETFPLWAQGGPWRDAGLYADFGIGGLKLEADGETKADGGATSIVGLGGFWEPVRFSIFSFGPNVEYTHVFSRTVHFTGITAGARLVLYTRP